MNQSRCALLTCSMLVFYSIAWAGADMPATHPAATSPVILQMKFTGGWGQGLLEDLQLRADGSYTWKQNPGNRTQTPALSLHGQLTPESLKTLLTRVRNAGPGEVADDAGTVDFILIGETGKQVIKHYGDPTESPCTELLQLAEEMARGNGHPD